MKIVKVEEIIGGKIVSVETSLGDEYKIVSFVIEKDGRKIICSVDSYEDVITCEE